MYRVLHSDDWQSGYRVVGLFESAIIAHQFVGSRIADALPGVQAYDALCEWGVEECDNPDDLAHDESEPEFNAVHALVWASRVYDGGDTDEEALAAADKAVAALRATSHWQEWHKITEELGLDNGYKRRVESIMYARERHANPE